MQFVERQAVRAALQGKAVALVGSGPGALANPKGLVDSHDVVIRVNNYKLFPATGFRTDVFYSFFGASIRKTPQQLMRDGVKLCLCKCPDAKFMQSAWHAKNGKLNGVDFRLIYAARKGWWFCDTYVPTVEEFMVPFNLLGKHVPTTGFAALLDVLACDPLHLYLTGFDFFASGLHNVNERHRTINPDDPIGHRPDRERAWLAANLQDYPLSMDAALSQQIMQHQAREAA
jgi:hypothetical protein